LRIAVAKWTTGWLLELPFKMDPLSRLTQVTPAWDALPTNGVLGGLVAGAPEIELFEALLD
jgi:hypothetical protein